MDIQYYLDQGLPSHMAVHYATRDAQIESKKRKDGEEMLGITPPSFVNGIASGTFYGAARKMEEQTEEESVYERIQKSAKSKPVKNSWKDINNDYLTAIARRAHEEAFAIIPDEEAYVAPINIPHTIQTLTDLGYEIIAPENVKDKDPLNDEEIIINVEELADAFTMKEMEKIEGFEISKDIEKYNSTYQSFLELIKSFKRNRNA